MPKVYRLLHRRRAGGAGLGGRPRLQRPAGLDRRSPPKAGSSRAPGRPDRLHAQFPPEGRRPSSASGCWRSSDYDFSMTYAILESPMGVENYVATLRLSPVTDGDRTLSPNGRAEFNCRAGPRGGARRPDRPQCLPGRPAGAAGAVSAGDEADDGPHLSRSTVIERRSRRLAARCGISTASGAGIRRSPQSHIEAGEPADLGRRRARLPARRRLDSCASS